MVTFDPTKSQLLSFRYKKWEYLQIRSCPSITILDEILRTKWRWKHGLNYSPPVWEFFSVFVISAVNPTKWNGFELSEMLVTIFWSRRFRNWPLPGSLLFSFVSFFFRRKSARLCEQTLRWFAYIPYGFFRQNSSMILYYSWYWESIRSTGCFHIGCELCWDVCKVYL